MARNGREAVAAFREGGVDLILMDVHMPEMDGIEATRRIRELEKQNGNHTPIIATTASVMTADQNKYLHVGMDIVVGKPIDFKELFAEIERIVPEDAGQALKDTKIALNPEADFEFPPLDGVDVVRGLKTWQNSDAYKKALLSFSETYSSIATDLSRLIRQEEQKESHHLIHTLKGVAGNLSVIDVYEVSSKISDALKKKNMKHARGMINQLAKAIDLVVESVRKLEDIGQSEEKPSKKLDLSRVLELFKEMLEAFGQFNPDIVEPHLNELRAYISEQQIAPIAKRVDEFQFIEAEKETIKLAKELGIDLEA